MDEKVKIGVIGCGSVSGAYFVMARNFPFLEMAACADLDMDRARAKAQEFGVPRACSVEEMLADGSIEIVLNLTVPRAHVPVALAALRAGKHVYGEKPFATGREEGRMLMAEAGRRGLKLGSAPDTFLGSGVQTARKLIDQGAIGRPVAFTAFMMCPGHESWHPNPEFYYQPGGGPMMDMGPYYLTALLNLLGPVRRISGAAAIEIPDRIIGSEPKRGQRIDVKTPDHVMGTMEFASGAVGCIVTSFATLHPTYDGKQPITIYGTEGTLRVPDPNQFDGPVHLRRREDAEWREMPPQFVVGYGRAVGLADMARGIRTGRAYRANAEQAFAVLDLMQGFLDSAASGTAYVPQVAYERPAAMPAGLPLGVLD